MSDERVWQRPPHERKRATKRVNAVQNDAARRIHCGSTDEKDVQAELGGDDRARSDSARSQEGVQLPAIGAESVTTSTVMPMKIVSPGSMSPGPRRINKSHKTTEKARKRAYGKRIPPMKLNQTPLPSVHRLSQLDEQVLILCQSALKKQPMGANQEGHRMSSKRLVELVKLNQDHEAIYAATQIQRLSRGYRTRCRMAAPDGPRYQHAARKIQFAFRRFCVVLQVHERVANKLNRCATKIQAMIRGNQCREQILGDRARWLANCITLFQRRFRGYRFWNIVLAMLQQRRHNASRDIQRCCRGGLARQRARAIRSERLQFARELEQTSLIHLQQPRCPACADDRCTEESLFHCFMTRYLGLHDFQGAKLLGLQGMQMFPSSAKFHFMYAILLQSMGDDLDIAMAYLRKAQITLKIEDAVITECERRYFFSALCFRKDDVAVLLDIAVLSQCTGKFNRADLYYQLALEQRAMDYSIPGYLSRVNMVDRLLLNYHRYRSLFNARQVNLLAKEVSISKRDGKVRMMVARFNHFTAIYPADESNTCRFNAIYLSDEEICRLLSPPEGEGKPNHDPKSVFRGYRDLAAWRTSNIRGSVRKSFKRSTREINTAASDLSSMPRKNALAQVYQREFLGLSILFMRPAEFSRFSDTRSKLRVSRENAETLLQDLLFIAPHTDSSSGSSPDMKSATSVPPFLHRVVIHVPVFKYRQGIIAEGLASFAAVNIQRYFRGFRIRARNRREALLHTIEQRQVDDLYARLHQNMVLRERRRVAAAAIQCTFKGYAIRALLMKWKTSTVVIQRIYRGHCGRKRANAFRNGNMMFYMAERVFQRGLEISGRRVMLTIDKCGLSFRLEAYDMVNCTLYPGFISKSSILGVIRYCNWSYAQQLIGRDITIHGKKATINRVSMMNPNDYDCIMSCTFSAINETPLTISDFDGLVSLGDCIHAINLRNMSKYGVDTEQLLPPINPSDTRRVVDEMVNHLTIVSAPPMATKELRNSIPGDAILALQPPPKFHYIFKKFDSQFIQYKVRDNKNLRKEPLVNHAQAPTQLIDQLVFPQIEALRGVTIGKHVFRKKCNRHAVQFTRCRCVLSPVTTAAYIETISLALSKESQQQS